jgi:polysaccharide export outer membrane protein
MKAAQIAQSSSAAFVLLAAGLLLAASGCHVIQADQQAVVCDMPRELCKGILPTYRVEPPDILTIDAVQLVPLASYKVRTFDVLAIDVKGTPSDMPLAGDFLVEAGGIIKLGPEYGTLRVAGMTVPGVEEALTAKLREIIREPRVSVSLVRSAPAQQIAGQHLVGPDGTVTLGSYGSVMIVGMTIAEAKQAIEDHLADYFEAPEVAVNVFAYNSKLYYVVTQGAGLGDGVYRFPVTGNETVLDAISQINGLTGVSSKRIWIARPGENSCGEDQILAVDWDAIAQRGEVDTNYQILPGDRVYVAQDRLIAFDTGIAKLTAPFERIFGFSLLGVSTVTRYSGPVLKGGGNRNSRF